MSSSGCSAGRLAPHWIPSTLVSGQITDITLPSQQTFIRLSLPSSYRATSNLRAPPLLLAFHGWGGHPSDFDTVASHGREYGYIVVSPLGSSDNGTRPASWHGAGTASSRSPVRALQPPSPRTCVDGSVGVCYFHSCRSGCRDPCSWTTCDDSVGFVRDLLTELKSSLCFDLGAIFATGVSNGGIFLYSLAASDVGASFAGFMPVIGSPHRGHNKPPAVPRPFFGLWGALDRVVPPHANGEARFHPSEPDVTLDTSHALGGWLYASSSAVVRTWATANSCANASLRSAGSACLGAACSISLANGAQCVGWSVGCTDGAEVVQCIHPGGHSSPGWVPMAHWAFMRAHSSLR